MAAPGYDPQFTTKIETMVFALAGQRTATAAEVIRFPAPFSGSLKYISATARAEGGTTPTLDIDVQQGTTSLLDSTLTVVTGSDTEGTLASDASFAKDAVMTVDLTLGGTSPTFDDITITMVFERD